MESQTEQNQIVPESVPTQTPVTPSAGQSLTAEQQAFINHFSWGAIFFTPIYYFATHLIKYGFLMLIPFYNIYLYFKGIFKARKLSWETNEWKDFAQFEKRQRLMDKIAVWFFSIWLVLFIAGISFTIFMVKDSLYGPNGPAKAATTFMDQTSAGDMRSAFDATAQEFKDIGTFPEFDEYAKKFLLGNSELKLTSFNVLNDEAVACGSVLDGMKEESPIVVYLVKEGEGDSKIWKVSGIDLAGDATCSL